MCSDLAIEAASLGKAYRIYKRPIDRVRELYSLRKRRYHTKFQALKDVTFSVQSGQTVGLIGPNGSGKSTLLEIMSGTLEPTEGRIEVRGRVAALLELGAGFNPAFTGRENVYLNGSLIGASRAELDERFDSVVAFSEIGDFIDHPVSTYSSGMYVRLAFATAIHCDPDILIVDEALAVGDIRFQRKCYRKIEEMKAEGRTIFFVTHAMDLIEAHCSQAMYLREGQLRAIGNPKEVINRYLEDSFGPKNVEWDEVKAAPQMESPEQIESALPEARQREAPDDRCRSRSSYNPGEFRWGDQRAAIYDYRFVNAQGQVEVHPPFQSGQDIFLVVQVYFAEPIAHPIFGITIKTVDGQTVFGANSRRRQLDLGPYAAGERVQLSLKFTAVLIPGQYFISLGIAEDDPSDDHQAVDRRYDLIHVALGGSRSDFGVADIGLEMNLSTESQD